MNNRLKHALVVAALLSSPAGQAQDTVNTQLEALRQEVMQMRSDYEARISELEARLAKAEESAAEASTTAEIAQQTASAAVSAESSYSSPQSVSVASDNAFNPAIGVIFQGQAWAYDQDPEDYQIPGFPFGGEAGLAPEGLSLAETEISMSANVDDKFTAWVTVPIAVEDGEVHVELEEAWVETLALPAGLSLKMGRFYSDIGYLNDKHFHSWDFADQPLVYQAFLGGQFLDDGLQARWLAPTDFYLELSGEVFRGGNYPSGGAANSGLGATTLGLKTGGDVGFSNSWLLGVSWLSADAVDRESGSEEDPLLFTGNTDIYIADFVWKWASNGNWKQRNFVFQAEYMWRDESGAYDVPGMYQGPWNENQQGWYAQAVYQPFPHWRFGARIDGLSADVPPPEWIGTPLYPASNNPARYSVMVDWSNSEFSRLRFQYNYDKSTPEDDNQFGLQYIFSIGAHGAHSF